MLTPSQKYRGKKVNFTIKPKSGTVRKSCHGVKTRRGKRIYIDCPTVGVVCLLDDIHHLVISFGDGYYPYNYKIKGYDG